MHSTGFGLSVPLKSCAWHTPDLAGVRYMGCVVAVRVRKMDLRSERDGEVCKLCESESDQFFVAFNL